MHEYQKTADPSDCGPRSLLQNLHFYRLERQSLFTFTRKTLMQLRLTYQQHSPANRKPHSSSSSVRTGSSSHGNLLICQVYPGGWLSTVCVSTQKQNQSKSIFYGPPLRRERRLARRWLGSCLLSSSKRLIRLQRIYNFLLFHAIILPLFGC